MSTTQTINWIAPHVALKSKNNTNIDIAVDFKDGRPPADINIKRTSEGFWYEEPGIQKRKFTTAEGLRWEFELPTDLVSLLESLEEAPIDPTDKTFINYDAMNAYMMDQPDMQTLIKNMMMASVKTYKKPGSPGSNVTPKKKKRKKRK